MLSKNFIVLFLFALIFLSTGSFSQDQGHLYTMTMITIPNDQMSEFLKFYETEGKPMDAQNEHILSVKIFTHAWGPSWKLCMVNEYKDWDGFLAADKRGDEIFEKTYPDSTKRVEIGKKWGGYLDNHTDAIVMDHPNLQK